MRRLLALLLLVASIPLLATACGGEAASGGAGPASVVPASATFYLEAVVRPEGDLREDALAAAGKVLRTDDPEARFGELLDQLASEGERGAFAFDYEQDVKPWLGERVGGWLTNLADEEPPGVIIAETTDGDKALEALDEGARREGGKPRSASYKGVDYQVDDGDAYGLVDGFVVMGEEGPFKRTVDASKGESLGESDRFEDTIDGLDDARIGTLFMDARAMTESLRSGSGGDPSVEQLESLLGVGKLPPIGAALLADGDRIAVETLSSTKGQGELLLGLTGLSGGGENPLVADLPADSWLAYGLPDLGETANELYGKFAGGLAGAAISGEVKKQTGLDLEQDVFAWMGDAALFVRGDDKASAEGALVIEATDEEKARRAVTRLMGALTRQSPGMAPRPYELDGSELTFRVDVGEPKPLIVAVGSGRFVAAYGELAARDGLEAGEKLGDTDGFQAAAQTLGGDADPAVYVAFPALLKLIGSTGTPDADYAKAKPYLETIESIVAGSEQEGDRLRSRFALELK